MTTNDPSQFQAMAAQSLHEEELLAKRNVVGVAVGYKNKGNETNGDVALVILVEQKMPLAALAADDLIPREIDGLRTDVVEVGFLRAQQTPRERFRPTIPSGVSLGHYKVTAGTLGAMVKDRTTGERLILSNNHVLANSNDALKGDAILQPGTMDGGLNPQDVIATLERFIALRYAGDPVDVPVPGIPTPTPTPTPPKTDGTCDIVSVVVALANALARLVGSQQRVTTTSAGSAAAFSAASVAAATAGGVPLTPQATVPENRVDAALARPTNLAQFSDQIQTIGAITGTKPPMLGMRVRKYGRTTEYTEGMITLLNATVNVGYSTAAGAKSARFVGQIITEPMSKGGDSGSLIVEVGGSNAIGLLFAGSDLATIFTPIDVVLQALNIRF